MVIGRLRELISEPYAKRLSLKSAPAMQFKRKPQKYFLSYFYFILQKITIRMKPITIRTANNFQIIFSSLVCSVSSKHKGQPLTTFSRILFGLLRPCFFMQMSQNRCLHGNFLPNCSSRSLRQNAHFSFSMVMTTLLFHESWIWYFERVSKVKISPSLIVGNFGVNLTIFLWGLTIKCLIDASFSRTFSRRTRKACHERFS